MFAKISTLQQIAEKLHSSIYNKHITLKSDIPFINDAWCEFNSFNIFNEIKIFASINTNYIKTRQYINNMYVKGFDCTLENNKYIIDFRNKYFTEHEFIHNIKDRIYDLLVKVTKSKHYHNTNNKHVLNRNVKFETNYFGVHIEVNVINKFLSIYINNTLLYRVTIEGMYECLTSTVGILDETLIFNSATIK